MRGAAPRGGLAAVAAVVVAVAGDGEPAAAVEPAVLQSPRERRWARVPLKAVFLLESAKSSNVSNRSHSGVACLETAVSSCPPLRLGGRLA